MNNMYKIFIDILDIVIIGSMVNCSIGENININKKKLLIIKSYYY